MRSFKNSFKSFFVALPLAISLFLCSPASEGATYYLNDLQTNGDVYVTAIGDDANSGLSAAAPKLTLTNLVATYTLAAGDTVYIDTGLYTNYSIVINGVNGTSNNPIRILGSTNYLVGGSIFDRRNSSAIALTLQSANFVEMKDLTFRGGLYGLLLFNVNNSTFESIATVSNSFGFYLNNGSSNRFLRSVAARNSTGVYNPAGAGFRWDYGVLWSNTTAFLISGSPRIAMSNSVVVGGTAFTGGGGMQVGSDYNIFWQTTLNDYDDLADGITRGGVFMSSTFADPQFANPAGLDFRPRSVVGRYDPVSATWVTDVVHSLMIDLASPSDPYSSEPAPNGGVANVGIYGNHPEASKSRTDPWVYALSFNDGGNLVSSGVLRWAYGAIPATGRVDLTYSLNAGATWTALASSVPVTNRAYTWSVAGVTSSPRAYWRIVWNGDTNVWDQNDQQFVIRASNTHEFAYYVNDTSTVNDVYSSASGAETNTGLSSSSPRLNLQTILDDYDIGSGDTIYLDTGVYATGATIRVKNRGESGRPVRIVGSTNYLATVIRPASAGWDGFNLGAGADHILIQDVFIDNPRYGVFVELANYSNEYRRLTIRGAQNGYRLLNGGQQAIRQSVLYSNQVGVISQTGLKDLLVDRMIAWGNRTAFNLPFAGQASIRNSIIGGGGTNFGGSVSQTNFDFNILWNVALGGSTPSLFELQKNVGAALNTTFANPQFVDPANLDFHLKSVAGRWDIATASIVTDAVHSVGIDFGDPSGEYSLEPLPNGGRVNAGNYGNTPFAGRSRTNGWLLATSLNDGGQLSIGDSVRWMFGNLVSGATVRIEYSGDNGASWQIIATNIAATAQTHAWSNTNYPSSYLGRYRVVLEADPGVLSSNTAAFTFRNGVFVYYVNDNSLVGDIFTEAVGNDANAGTTPASPRADLAKLFDDFDLEPGDVVYVDTGLHRTSTVPQLGTPDSGDTTNPVHLVFSPNFAAGGAILDRVSKGTSSEGLRFLAGSANIEVRNLVVTNAGIGARVTSSTNIVFRNARIRGVAEAGFLITNSVLTRIENSVAYLNDNAGLRSDNNTNLSVSSSVFWKNSGPQIQVQGGALFMTGSVLVASGPRSLGYLTTSRTNVFADYNAIYVESNASVAAIASISSPVDHLGAWQFYAGQDRRSTAAEPRFGNPEQGDFHLRSDVPGGRFDPFQQVWVTDFDHSPLIDAGDPSWSAALEPSPNGGRADIGMYANTAEASLSRSTPWLHAAAFRRGGWVKGTGTLHWVSGNLPTNSLVRVDLSLNAGETWSVLSTGILAATEVLSWNTLLTNDAAAALWRVTSLSDTNVSDQTTNFFSIRNGPMSFYLNDADVTGDNYSSGPGSATNWVATANRPLSSVSRFFSRYDLEPGDIVYVDAGSYLENENVLMKTWVSGISTTPLRVYGPTNGVVARVLRGDSAPGSIGLDMNYAQWISITNVVFQGAHIGVQISQSANLALSLSANANASNGFEVLFSTNIVFQRSVAARNQGRGMYFLTNAPVKVEHSVVWSNRAGAIRFRGTDLSVSNSVLHTADSDSFLYTKDMAGDTLRSDYNDMLAAGRAQVGLIAGHAYRYLADWQQGAGLGSSSLSHDPQFADPDGDDYHVRSQAGRFVPGGAWVTDTNTSPIIDAGDPARSFASETAPNGGRLNMGLYGNHAQASHSPTNARLVSISYNDGGFVRGTNTLVWMAYGAATDHTVRIEFSADGGNSWTSVVSGLAAASGIYTNWDTTLHGSTIQGVWRIVSETDTNVMDATDNIFALNNGALTYYVNDESTDGDIYSSAPGSAVNDGASPLNPALGVQQILDNYTLNPGDRILVDTGVYPLSAPITFNSSVMGESTNHILLQGSTNFGVGGTVFDAQGGSRGVFVQNTGGIMLKDFRVQDARTGIYLQFTTNCVIDNVTIVGMKGVQQQVYGIEVVSSVGAIARRTSISGVTNSTQSAAIRLESSSSFKWLDGVFWSNRTGVALSGSSAHVSNSVFVAFGAASQIYDLDLNSSVLSDYNDYFLTNGARMGRSQSLLYQQGQQRLTMPVYYDSVFDWVRLVGMDQNSLSHDPQFADPDNEDYHLMSTEGRYDPVAGWVTDAVSSALIDAGPPSVDFSEETAPNGGRRNMGRYGNTPEASRTPPAGRLTAISYNDSGIVSGTNVLLSWHASGAVTNHQKRVDISYDNGFSWLPMASNITAGISTVRWDTTTALFQGPNIRWRVQSQSDANIVDANDHWIQIRNSNVVYYVNDANTNGDVYTARAGFETYDGLSPSNPLPNLTMLLDRYDVEPGDWIYVDTGNYDLTGRVTLTSLDSGAELTNWVTIFGSTNQTAGGSVFKAGITFEGARDVRIENIAIEPALSKDPIGFQALSASNVQARSIRVSKSYGHGFEVWQSGDILLDRSVSQGSVSNGLYDFNSFGVVWQNGVLWSNRTGVNAASQPVEGLHLSVSHSVIGAVSTNQTAVVTGGSYSPDYNAIFVTNGAALALLSVGKQYPLRYESLGRWVLDTGKDSHSIAIDPLFAQAGMDFHSRSAAGRYDPTANQFVNDDKTSWLIDTGDPLVSYSLEPAPDGGRRNIGIYGDTPEASKSPTNAELLAVSLRDGGIAGGTNQLLYWVARGAATADTVRVEYSPDNGLTWTTLASSVSATAGSVIWNTTNTPSTVLGAWRVVSESATNLIGQSLVPFAVRNTSIPFYVNDVSTNGDVYCTAPGSDSNSGVSPATPMLSLKKLLETYDLEPGDTIYIDTGVYSNTSTIQITQGDSGDTNGLKAVSIVGSTNSAAGGTVLLSPGPQFSTMQLFDVEVIVLKDLIFSGDAGTHISVQESKNIRFERVHTVGGRIGILLSSVSGVLGVNTVLQDYLQTGLSAVSAGSVSWGSGVFWSSGTNAITLARSSISVSNTAFGMMAEGSRAYDFEELSELSSEYNNFWLAEGAILAHKSFSAEYKGEVLLPMQWQNLARWTRDVGMDRFSLSVDPLFADPASGDFHLKSAGGRYDPTGEVFVIDSETSPLIDAGSPHAAFAGELAPNGGRINIGAFGNTLWASHSSSLPLLQVVYLNDGGRAEGVAQPLYWIAYGSATDHTIRIELSTDGGDTWDVLQSNLPARISSPIFWDTTTTTSTTRAYWRIVSEQSNSVVSTSRKIFAIRNEPLSFYVNDASTADDVYTTNPGSPLQHGASPDQPRDTLQSLLDDYDLEPGDTIYMDTGLYQLENRGIEWSRFDGWDVMTNTTPVVSGVSVTLQGSTNYDAGGTRITAYQASPALLLSNAVGVAIRDLSIRQVSQGSGIGLRAFQSHYSKLYRVETLNGDTGFRIERSVGVTLSNNLARGNSQAGLRTFESGGTRWYNGLLWSNKYGVLQADLSTNKLTVENTAIGIWGEGTFAFFQNRADNSSDGVLLSDYNSVYRNNGGFFAAITLSSKLGGGTTRYEKVTSWINATGNDRRTLTGDPLLAGGGDFHLQSYAGRYLSGSGYITNMADSISPLIDAGRPGSPFGQEPSPNGSRVNIGPYGNTSEASKTPPTNGHLHVISLNDGGSALGTIELYWVATGVATGHLVNLEYSSNGGGTWTSIVSGIAASAGMYAWDSEPYGRAAAGVWRITSATDPGISDSSDIYFALRNGGSIPYYVNDGSHDGDVYCTAIGSDFNDGFIPSTPKATLQALLNAIDLEPGDIVYVDTGVYLLSDTTVARDLDAGTPQAPVVIQGSTNLVAGGTVFNRQTGAGTAIEFRETAGVELRDVRIINAGDAVLLTRSENIRITGVRSENNTRSFVVDESVSNEFTRNISHLTSDGLVVSKGDAKWRNGVIYGVARPFVLADRGSVDLRNSYTRALGSSARIFTLVNTAGSLTGDYNVYQRDQDALMYERERLTGGNEILPSLTDWQAAYSQDVHSLTHAPLLVNPEAGDFTPRSATGRFLPSGAMTNDPGVYSPLLDTGDPAFAWTNELAPNGGRINIGHLGNTAMSSLSQTNPWLLALTFNDGGVIRGTVTVYWASGGMTNGTRVRLEQALDGVDFSPFATNVLASQGSATWDVSSLPISYQARWRVVCENCGAQSQNETPVTIKNETLYIYVNDSITNGDVYAIAAGSPTNTGLSASQPLDSPETALERYVLGPDDIVYVDTGTYPLSSDKGLVVGLSGSVIESGLSNHPIRVVGSTNYAAGGSLIMGTGSTNSYALQINKSSFVDIEHLRLTGAGYGLSVDNSPDIAMRDIEIFDNEMGGIYARDKATLSMDRMKIWGNRGYGMRMISQSAARMNRSIFWGNSSGGATVGGSSFLVSNSIIVASVSNSYGYVLTDIQGSIGGDYNIFWTDPFSLPARDQFKRIDYKNLRSLQNAFSSDEHSAFLDPLFASPDTGDFHLQSAVGRYAGGNWVADATTSWAIDAGAPSVSFDNEPMPNGGRMNAGVYANTSEASMSVTNPLERALQIISFDDGGLMPAPQYLRWMARGYSDEDTITLQFSPNLGVAWIAIATNIAATSGQFYWSPDPTNSSPVTLWRILTEGGVPQGVTNSKYFALRLQPIKFYVNDDSTFGDIYTYAVGSPTNDGLTPLQPMDSLAALVAMYDMEPEDQVLVDTGYYIETNTVGFYAINAGSTNGPVYITGSTNWQAGGTILNRASQNIGSQTNADAAFEFFYTRYMDVSHFTLVSANVAVVSDNSQGIVLSNLVLRNNGNGGMLFQKTDDTIVRNSLITATDGYGINLSDGAIAFDSGIIWSNSSSAILVQKGVARVTNSVLHATGTNYPFKIAEENAQIVSDYNNLVLEGGARPALIGGLDLEGLLQWSIFTGNDVHSLAVNPLFADPAGMDFHLLSEFGRFDPQFEQFLTNDVQTSYLVDAGPPLYSYANEPMPNGGRRNIGIYGNTPFASKGRTDAWLMMLTGNSGGRANGIFPVAWAWGQMSETNRVSLDFSYDNGTNWVRIASNLLVSAGLYRWDSILDPLAVSPIARLRITQDADTNIWDVTDRSFALNGPFKFYLNDEVLTGDVFASAVGSDSNLGFYTNTPMRSFGALLNVWDLDPGDAIYIDTGNYPIYSNTIVTLAESDSGGEVENVHLVASTNSGGAVFEWMEPLSGNVGPAIVVLQGPYLTFNGARFKNGGLETSGTNHTLYNLSFTNASMRTSGQGTLVSNIAVDVGIYSTAGSTQTHSRVIVRNGRIELNGKDITLQNSLAYGTQSVAAVTVGGRNIALINNTIVGSRTAIILAGEDASLTLRNNTIVANAAAGESYVVRIDSGSLNSDYNNLVARNGAWIGNVNGSWERLLYWQVASLQDLNSISADPMFANESGGDFHPKSLTGRWTPTGIVTDSVHAATIDMGAPYMAFNNEPLPHGGRVNIGAYGNTEQASRGRVDPWLFAMTMNDGGVVKGTNVTLRWATGNLTNGATVTLRYSSDGGGSWITIAPGLDAASGAFVWDTTQVPSSFDARWDVTLDGDTNVYDMVDSSFNVRNAIQKFYVNDSSTTGDVYTAVIGSSGNTGLSPFSPLDSLSGLLAKYDIEGGDVVYVDTGVYNTPQNTAVIWSRGGDSTNGPVWIWGSTNFAAGGSVLSRGSRAAGAAALDIKASYVRARNLTLQSAQTGVLLDSNSYVTVERMRVTNSTVGITASDTFRAMVRNNLLLSLTNGVQLVRAVSNTVENNVFYENEEAGVLLSGGSSPNILQNNIFSLAHTTAVAYAGVFSDAFVDYNIYEFRTNRAAIFGSQRNLLQWQLEDARDYRSAVTNPLFANASSGDFHLKSTIGRWQEGTGFVVDGESSWGVDRGATNSLYDSEQLPNGARINIGAYGNTEYASKGLASTQTLVEARVLNTPTYISQTNSTWPLIWGAINVPTTELFRVEFSGDGGVTWYVLTNAVPASQEFIVWTATPFFNTEKGLWRVVGINDTNYWDVNDAQFRLFFGTFTVTQIFYDGITNGIIFRGAWAEQYQVQWGSNLNGNAIAWTNAVTGPGPLEKASFLSTNGGDFTYRDIESVTNRYRLYRVIKE